MDPAADGPAIRGRLGVCPQEDTLDNELNVRDNLYIYGRYFGLPKAEVNDRVRRAARLRPAHREGQEQGRGPQRRHEAPADDRAEPGQPPRPAPARRADHRPRPAGAARALGPAVPAQAVGRDAGDHHPLHGRGRAALRPAGRHGQGADRGRGLAARADPRSTPPARSPSCGSAWPTEGETHDALAEKVADLGERVEVLPDRLLVYSDDGDAVIAQVHERGLRAGRDAGAPQHPGGRLPPPHRPDAGRLMATWRRDSRRPARGSLDGVRRQVDYWSVVYQRTWRASVITSFLSPLLYVAGDGRAARRLHRRRPRRARGRDVLPRLRGPRPDRRARDADRGRRDDVPGDGHDQVAAHLRLDARHPAAGCRDLVAAAPVASWLFRLATTCGGLHARAGAVRRLRQLVGADRGVRAPAARRHGLRDVDLRLQRPAAVRGGVRAPVPAGHLPAVPVQRRVLPGQQPRRPSAPGSPGSRRCGTA